MNIVPTCTLTGGPKRLLLPLLLALLPVSNALAQTGEQVRQHLGKAQEIVVSLRQDGAADEARRAQRMQQLREHLSVIKAGRPGVRAELAATRARLVAAGVPAAILARQDAAAADIEARAEEFDKRSNAWQVMPAQAQLQSLEDLLQQAPALQRKAHNPGKLP